MLSDDNLRLMRKFSAMLAKNKQDAEDIAQRGVELYLRNPSEVLPLNNSFIFTIVRRARFLFYFRPRTKVRRVLEVYGDVYEDEIEKLVELQTPEKLYMEKEALEKLRTVEVTGITPKERELLQKMLAGYETKSVDRTHLVNLQNKIRERLT